MVKGPRMNEAVYAIAYADMGISIVKGRIVGCYQQLSEVELRYLIDTPMGRLERFQRDIFRSIDDIRESLSDYVIGE